MNIIFDKKIGILASLGFLGCVVGANWAISTFGLVPVGFGLVAPAGVYFAGLTFGLRDLVQERGNRFWILGLIFLGACLSYLISDGSSIPSGYVSIAFASFCAFLFSETADFLVYSPLREKHLIGAVVASNAVGSVIDSLIFLMLAFGSVEFIWGQLLGKFWMTVPAVFFVKMLRSR
jgi:uncharacterized PurR-regulated membrane protein YhhQ (DUF165 family)